MSIVVNIYYSGENGSARKFTKEIPSSVTKIGDYAFHRCSGLTTLNLPSNVTSIGYRAFSECSDLTSVDLPSSITNIGDYVF